MSNVVFILGAGCSKECGAPLMAEFLDVARNLYTLGKIVGQEAEHFKKVFEAIGALQRVHSKSQLDLYNIESVFNAFEMSNTIGKLPGVQVEQIPSVIDSLKKVIVTTLEKTIQFPTIKSYVDAPLTYKSFAGLLRHVTSEATPKRTVSVITFNYDIAIDMALFRAGLGVGYWLDSSTPSEATPLLKLHGSLNWASPNDSGDVIPLTLEKYFQEYSFIGTDEVRNCFIPIGTKLQEYFSRRTRITVKAEPVIVPPTWNKAEHHQSLSKVWGRAAKELGEAEYIFIMGYSLPGTDAFFRLLYALGTVGDSPLNKIEVFNPDDSSETRNRFESLLGPAAKARFKYNAVNFSNSFSLLKAYFPRVQ